MKGLIKTIKISSKQIKLFMYIALQIAFHATFVHYIILPIDPLFIELVLIVMLLITIPIYIMVQLFTALCFTVSYAILYLLKIKNVNYLNLFFYTNSAMMLTWMIGYKEILGIGLIDSNLIRVVYFLLYPVFMSIAIRKIYVSKKKYFGHVVLLFCIAYIMYLVY